MMSLTRTSLCTGALTAWLLLVALGCSGNASLGGGGAANLGGAVNTGGKPPTGGTTSTSTYQPCAGKQCGDTCTICPPNSLSCGETAVIKTCSLSGQCLPGTQQCSTTASGGSNSSGGANSSGGSNGSGGSNSSGGDTCAIMECFRAVNCVAYCGGPVLISGCCACATGTMDQAECTSSSGGASSAGGAPNTASGGAPSTGGSAATGGTSSGVKCGAAVCGATEDCCNASCSLCVPKGNGCVTMVCATGGSTSTGGATGAGGTTSITGLHTSCTSGTCPAGLTPTEYYGIAGTSGPLFCSCEIPCATAITGTSTVRSCPTGMACTDISDGPSAVCY